MNKKLLLIWGAEESFFSTNITELLQEAGVEVVRARPAINDVAHNIAEADLIVLYVSDDITTNKELQCYLRDCCIEREKKLCLVGYKDNLSVARETLHDSYVVAEYFRPIDVKSLGAELIKELKALGQAPVKRHILIVDDDPMTLRAEKTWFETKYQVSIVNSAAMAFTFLAKNQPDLILLDYDMPHCKGSQFYEMIHSEESLRSIPVIFLTGKADGQSVHEVIGLRPAGYLLKSMSPLKVVAYVDDFFVKQDQLRKQHQF